MTTFNDATKDMRAAIYGSDYDQGYVTVNDVPIEVKNLVMEYTNNIETGEPMPNSTTLKLILTNIEDGRARATIATTDGGIYAEAADPQTAAGQAVKTYLALHPIEENLRTTFRFTATPERKPVWKYSLPVIKQLLHDAITTGGKVKVEYEDEHGHETTRVIVPEKIKPNGTVVVYDELRQAVRTLRIDRVKAIQEMR
jgi:hypothetical protein